MVRSAKGAAVREGKWRHRRFAAGIIGSSLATFGALLIVASSTLGAVGPAVTQKAPYKAALVTLTNPTSISGCGKGAIVKAAFFNKTSGIGGFSDNGTTSWCTTSTNNSARYTSQIVVSIPIHVTTTGAHTISAVWITVAIGSVNMTAGTCTGSSTTAYTGCNRASSTFVYGAAYLLDKTTHKKVGPSNKWLGNSTYVANYTSCYYTTCTSTGTSKTSSSFSTGSSFWAWDWNSTAMTATDKYVLHMVIFGGVNVVLKVSGATLTGASANAQLNSGTGGNDEDLYSISIT